MRIFVAGATGAVGGILVERLLAAGHTVVGTSRTPDGARRVREQGAEGVQVDVFDAAALDRAVGDAAPDAVIHQLTALAGGTPADNGRIRRVGTRNLVDAAKRAGVRRIVAQSISWIYAPGTRPADEQVPFDTDAAEPRASLIGSVRALEDAVAELDRHVVLRYGRLYGPGTWYRPDGAIVRALRGENDPAAAFLGTLAADDAVSSFVHVEDAARAAVLALDWPDGPVNIVDDEPVAARDWLPVLARAVGAPVPDVVAGGAGWERGATDALARSRGWIPRPAGWRTGFVDSRFPPRK